MLNDNNGLPQNSIRSLYYDPQTNFLWLATEAGLVRYDGRETRVFDNRDMPWLQSMRIHNLLTTVSGKVIGVNILGEAFSIQKDYPVPEAPVEAGRVRDAIYRDGNARSLSSFSFEQAVLKNKQLSFGQVSTILWLNDTAWLVNFKNNMCLLHRDRIVQQWPHPPDSLGLIKIARANMVYVMDLRGNGFSIDRVSNQQAPLLVQSKLLASGKGRVFYKKLSDHPLLLHDNEVHEIIFKGNIVSTRLMAVLPVVPSYINTLTFDKTGRYLFVATNTTGLYIFRLSPFRVYTVADDDIYNAQYACVPVDSQQVFSSRSILFNTQTGAATRLPVTMVNKNALAVDSSGSVWGQTAYDNKQSISRFRVDRMGQLTEELRLPDTMVTVYRGNGGRIWISTWRFIGWMNGSKLQPLVRYQQPEERLRFLTETPDKQLLGINDSGMVRVDAVAKKLVPLFGNRLLYQARFIQADTGGYCWLATYGNGIFLGNIKTGKLVQLPVDDKGYLQYSHALINEDDKHFLVPTNKGLFRLSKSNLLQIAMAPATPLCYQYFDVNDGLLTNEFNGGCQPAYNRLPNGDVLLPALRGLVRIKMKDLALPIASRVVVDDIETRLGHIRISSNPIFDKSERTQTWRLSITQWAPANSQGLFYRLDNDSAWQRLPVGEISIRLSELNGGNHVLDIRYQYGLSANEYTDTRYLFSIGRYFYETVWFWLVVLLLLAGLVYGIVRLRNQQLQRKNARLQAIIRHNTQDLSNKNEQLEDTLVDLREALRSLRENSIFKDRLIGVLGHDMMVPLRFINHIADHLHGSDAAHTAAMAKDSSSKIKHTATELLYLGEGLIQWIKLQEGRFRLIVKPIELRQLTEEIFQVHQPLAAVKNNRLVCNIPPNTNGNYDAVFLKVILHNLLLNANKYTVDGRISVDASISEKALLFWVQDTGSGMADSLVQSLNNGVAVPSQLGTNKETGWGMGYVLIIDLLRFASGTLLVQSTPGSGTTIHFNLPLQTDKP